MNNAFKAINSIAQGKHKMSRVQLLSQVEIPTNSRQSSFFDLKAGESAVIRIVGDYHIFVEYNSKFDKRTPPVAFPDVAEDPKITRYGLVGVEDQYSKAGFVPKVHAAFNILVKQPDGTNTHAIWNVSSTIIDKLKDIEKTLFKEDDVDVALGSVNSRWLEVSAVGKKDKNNKIVRDWSVIIMPIKKSPALTAADIAVLKEAGAPKDEDLKKLVDSDDEPEWYYFGAPLPRIFGPRKPKTEGDASSDTEMSVEELSLGDEETEEEKKARLAKEARKAKAVAAAKAAEEAAKAAAEVDGEEEEGSEDFPDLTDWDK